MMPYRKLGLVLCTGDDGRACLSFGRPPQCAPNKTRKGP